LIRCAFCAAAQTLKFREAATQLGLAPQQVTRGIAELEKQLGEMLFMRNTRQIKLTPFGQQFWPKVVQLLVESEALFAIGKNRNPHDMAGKVRITLPRCLKTAISSASYCTGLQTILKLPLNGIIPGDISIL
jgi:DNA-binding transcriptional LysR family regulator